MNEGGLRVGFLGAGRILVFEPQTMSAVLVDRPTNVRGTLEEA